jgi:hypothetical protein
MGSGSVPGVNAGPAGVLRRAPDEPKPLRTDIAHVPVSTTSEEKVHVIRKMMPCECRKVPDVREGVFYNPNLNALAIAYRHCSGGTRTDVYAEVQSNLSSFLAGGPPPTGTGRIGFEINVVGKKVGAKATLEVTGSNVTGGQGVGGRAQVVFQGDKWRVFVTSNFLHGLGANSGDVLDLNLGGRLGPITAELQVQNLLTPSPTTTGDVCADLPGTSIRACFEIFGSGGVGAGLKGPLGGPQRDRDECFQCLCPPPTKHYTCYHDVPPTEKQVEREIEVQVPHEHRFYFALDHKSAPSEDKTLTSQGETNLGNVEKDVKAGGSVVMVTGYASPEAKEGHNADLSMGRAKTIVERLRTKLPGTTIPEPIGGGEVLGRRPKAVPSSKLGEAFQGAGFRSAEEMSFLLLGEEILEPDLADQFVSLFNKITDPADRLAIFGLDANSPIKEKVLKTVDEFMRKPHAGSRPWENVFRLLRVAVVRTSIPEKQKITETERTSDSIDVLGEAACELQAEKAEQAGLLPPVPEELRTSNRSREDREAECLIEVKPADRRTGCDYTVTEDMKLRPHAPPRAPRPLF